MRAATGKDENPLLPPDVLAYIEKVQSGDDTIKLFDVEEECRTIRDGIAVRNDAPVGADGLQLEDFQQGARLVQEGAEPESLRFVRGRRRHHKGGESS